jgi:hypothetical protein
MDLIWFDLSFHVKTPTAFSLFFCHRNRNNNSWKFGLLAGNRMSAPHFGPRVARPLFTIIGF